MKKNKEKVAAAVVTFNRKDLLQECLEALLNQTRKLDAIIIIDNHSNDGTKELIKEKYSKKKIVNYVRLNKNYGAAGGYYLGMKKAYEKGFDWIWMLDDDAITYKDALEKLMNSLKELPKNTGFLCSNVYGLSGNVMNVPNIDLRPSKNKYPSWNTFLEKGFVEISSCGWMSIFSRKVIKKIGYPIKEIFLWGDDDDFTRKTSKFYKGFLIGSSKILHKRKIENSLDIVMEEDRVRIKNFYFLYRNSFYTMKKNGDRKIFFMYILGLPFKFMRIIKSSNFLPKVSVFIKGTIAGIFFNPKTEFPKD